MRKLTLAVERLLNGQVTPECGPKTTNPAGQQQQARFVRVDQTAVVLSKPSGGDLPQQGPGQ